jgi:hypothetical protein
MSELTAEDFRCLYEDWGTQSRLDAEVEALTVRVPGERVIVAGFTLGTGREWTLRLESDRPSFDDTVIVVD